METKEFAFFCSHHQTKETVIDGIGLEVLSQWYESIFFDEHGQKYTNCEQYMMSKKAKLFNDKATREKILATSNPKEIKALGRTVAKFNQVTWDRDKEYILVKGNLLKFRQNPALKKRLLQTETKIIAEAADYDKIYGIGCNEIEAMEGIKSGDYRFMYGGQNLLGLALMKVRFLLQEE